MSWGGNDNYWPAPPPNVHTYGPNEGPNVPEPDGAGLLIGFLLLGALVLVFGAGFVLMSTNIGSLCGGG